MIRGREPRIVLAAFCVLLAIVSVFHRGHSVESVDVRTYVQMVQAAAESGVPCWDNGPLDQWPLVVPHATPAHGLVCGPYSPLYPYLFAPIFKVGGLELVSAITFMTLILIALATFTLTRRLVENEWYATAAGMLSVISTPLAAKALEMTSFPLAALFATVATYFTVRVVEEKNTKVAIACGFAWALSTAAHVLTFPMALAALVVIAVARARASIAALALALGFLPIALLNRYRFDSYNPISYGPGGGPPGMTLRDQIEFAVPLAALVLVAGVSVFLLRRRGAWALAAAAAAIVIVLIVPRLRHDIVRIAVLAIGYVADLTVVALELPYERSPDGLGIFNGGWVVKSTLQCTPLLALAPLAWRENEKRWRLAAVLVPSVALYLSFLTRANMSYGHALGWPWVYNRYVLPALPSLLAASMVVVERTRPSLRAIAIGAAISALLAWRFIESRDVIASKRIVLLVVPLVLAMAAIVTVLRKSRHASAFVVACASLGIASSLGHDLRANLLWKTFCDGYVDGFSKEAAPKMALLGRVNDFDVLLSVKATHDVRYADIDQFPMLRNLRPLVDHWRAEGRVVYFHEPRGRPELPWPDVKLVPLATANVYRFDFEPTSSSPTSAPTE